MTATTRTTWTHIIPGTFTGSRCTSILLYSRSEGYAETWWITGTGSARKIDQVVIATTTNASDDPVVREAERLRTGVHRGSEYDVLERYVGAARACHAGIVVRITLPPSC